MIGNCVECEFPIKLTGLGKVACPACGTINAPISVGITGLDVLFVSAMGAFAFLIARRK